MRNELNESIEQTKKGFEESFATETFYNKQTQDKEHLNVIGLDIVEQALIKNREKVVEDGHIKFYT